MAKEKENKSKKNEEIVGLDDDDVRDEEENGQKESFVKVLLEKYKKFIIPAVFALAIFGITVVAIKFIHAPSDGLSEEVSADESNQTEIMDNTELSMEDLMQDNNDESGNIAEEEPADEFAIDTSAIMADLAFLDYTPEMEAEEKKIKEMADGSISDGSEDNYNITVSMTPQDSIDTLNWLNKELKKLDKARAENAQLMKKMKALQYKIDQALVKIKQTESARIINLARLYDGMRPEQVGKLFENLDDKAVMAILPRMKSANAAKIMAIMPPKRAARISTKMITVLE